MGKTGLYIHIPFCVRKCNYCAFLSFNAFESPRKEYSEAMINEIRIAGKMFCAENCGVTMHSGKITADECAHIDPAFANECVHIDPATTGECAHIDPAAERQSLKRHIDTIYIGGGTPSVMDVSQLSLIMKAVRSEFDIDENAEITLEANPGTLGKTERVTRTKLIAYKYMGVNRLSLGVQSMDNDRLSYLGRIHTAEDVARDIRYAREAGFSNINLDLIFSVPGETTEQALEDARRIIDLGPEHISCYSLQLEEGTPFYEMAERGELRETDDEEDRRTYHKLCELLEESGYEQYEISNFALRNNAGISPYRSRHNSSYWDMSEYIGLGLGASGFVNSVRYRNTTDLDKYLKIYGEPEKAVGSGPECVSFVPKDAYEEWHENTAFDNASEAVFTGLRRREGVTYEDALKAYGSAGHSISSEERFWSIFPDAREQALEYRDQGFLIIDDTGLRLTRQGIDISNGIMSLFV